MGNSNSCDENCKVQRAMRCFKQSVELQKQFKQRMKAIMRDENPKSLAESIVNADFKYALEHYNDNPRPAKLQEIYNRYPTLLQFLPQCADTCIKF